MLIIVIIIITKKNLTIEISDVIFFFKFLSNYSLYYLQSLLILLCVDIYFIL